MVISAKVDRYVASIGRRGAGVPFALARTRGLAEDLKSLLGVKGIHRASMLPVVVVVVVVVGGVAISGAVDDNDRRGSIRPAATAALAVADAVDPQATATRPMALLGAVDARLRMRRLLVSWPGTFMTPAIATCVFCS